MKRIGIALSAILAALVLFVLACAFEPSAAEKMLLTQELMRSSEASSHPDMAKGLSRTLPAPPSGLAILPDGTWWQEEIPPADGSWGGGLTVTFTDFVPAGYEDSTVNGSLDCTIDVAFTAGSPQLLTMTFSGTLNVTGEYAGAYTLAAILYYDFTARRYSYDGSVTIEAQTYSFTG